MFFYDKICCDLGFFFCGQVSLQSGKKNTAAKDVKGSLNIQMEKIKKFYGGLSKQKKTIVWVCLAVVLLSIVRIAVWQATKGGLPGPKSYVKKLADGSPEEKKFAIYEVGRREMKPALPALEKILREDSSEDMKRAACWSIGKIDINRLVSLLSGSPREVKYIIMETLMKLDMKNVSVLMGIFPSEEEDVKLVILDYAAGSEAGESLYGEIMGIAGNKQESLTVRKAALETAVKHSSGADMESRLWNIYYNDTEDGMKQFARELLKKLEEKKR